MFYFVHHSDKKTEIGGENGKVWSLQNQNKAADKNVKNTPLFVFLAYVKQADNSSFLKSSLILVNSHVLLLEPKKNPLFACHSLLHNNAHIWTRMWGTSQSIKRESGQM